MGAVPPLLTFLLMVVAGWVHRHQLIVIEFLQAENRLLKVRLRGRRIRFTDADQRSSLMPVALTTRAQSARSMVIVSKKCSGESPIVWAPNFVIGAAMLARFRLAAIALLSCCTICLLY